VLLKFPEEEKFIAEFNHHNCITKYGHLSLFDAYKTDFVKLNELSVIYNKEMPVFLIEAWINNLILFLGFNKTLRDYQVAELSGYIYDEIHFLNIAELTILFKRIKTGYYGEFFNSINVSNIIKWCREFRKERGSIISKSKEVDLSKEGQEINRAYLSWKKWKRKMIRCKYRHVIR